MEQYVLPSGLRFRKGQSFGNLQQAPQFVHCPLRLLETGSIEVKVLFILADQVFLFVSAISNDVINIKHPQFLRDAIKIRFLFHTMIMPANGCSRFVSVERFYDFLKTATTFSISTTNRRLSPSKSTGMTFLGLNNTLSY